MSNTLSETLVGYVEPVVESVTSWKSADHRPDPEAWSALAEAYHRMLTGTLLGLVAHRGTDAAARVVYRIFRTQHLELFGPGLAKLGLTDLPDAVACAQYHVLSNAIGGVDVAWIPESDRKSWVRYRPPRWIWDGTAVCGIPTEVNRAMLRGWHGHNGVSLGNDRLGFVCTKLTTDGQPGLEGYYIEEDQPLDPEDRVRFRPGERPPTDPVDLPLPSWEPERLAKADRNYAAAYIRNLLAAMTSELGPGDASGVGGLAATQIGMQYQPAVMALLGSAPSTGTQTFGRRLGRLLAAQGDPVTVYPDSDGHGERVQVESWRLTGGLTLHPTAFDIWSSLWQGMAAMEGLRLVVESRIDLGDPVNSWRVRPDRP